MFNRVNSWQNNQVNSVLLNRQDAQQMSLPDQLNCELPTNGKWQLLHRTKRHTRPAKNVGSCFGFGVPVYGFKMAVFCNVSQILVVHHLFVVCVVPTANMCNVPTHYKNLWRVTKLWYSEPPNCTLNFKQNLRFAVIRLIGPTQTWKDWVKLKMDWTVKCVWIYGTGTTWSRGFSRCVNLLQIQLLSCSSDWIQKG